MTAALHMKHTVTTILIALLSVTATNSSADCNCDDWVKKGGYCVDYVKSRIPIFPIPQDATAIISLKNKEIKDVEKGDVVIFDLGRYWHVAFVEKVHFDRQGNAKAVDVSEMNFGSQMSFEYFKDKWGLASKIEWKRAICCGITKAYGKTGKRMNIELNYINQVWTSESFAFQNIKSSEG
jgi:hypothetical protein